MPILGNKCENNIDDCISHNCQNNATCRDGINEFFCECLPGFSGSTCTVNIDECSTNPCQNGGTCQDGIAEYICSCKAGYSGGKCETCIDPEECNKSDGKSKITSKFVCPIVIYFYLLKK